MRKFVIEGVETVRDVIEAADIDEAKLLFRAMYPAVYEITNALVLEEFGRELSRSSKSVRRG
jgi:hypothetical protein